MCRPNCFLHARVIPDTPPIKSSIGNGEIPVTIGAQDEHVKKTTTPWSRRTHSLFARWLAVAALQQPSRPQLRRVVPYHQMAVLPADLAVSSKNSRPQVRATRSSPGWGPDKTSRSIPGARLSARAEDRQQCRATSRHPRARDPGAALAVPTAIRRQAELLTDAYQRYRN